MHLDLVLPTLPEQLPRTVGVTLRAELARMLESALARNNQPELARLHRQLSLLLQSLPHDESDEQSADAAMNTPAPRDRRSRPSSWRRPQAPIHYPYGHVPPVSAPRRSDPVTSMPDSALSADCRTRLDAYRRFMREKDKSGES